MKQIEVLEVYRITLLSNRQSRGLINEIVLEVYRITLLSNNEEHAADEAECFRGLQNYTTLKQ